MSYALKEGASATFRVEDKIDAENFNRVGVRARTGQFYRITRVSKAEVVDELLPEPGEKT